MGLHRLPKGSNPGQTRLIKTLSYLASPENFFDQFIMRIAQIPGLVKSPTPNKSKFRSLASPHHVISPVGFHLSVTR
jgi:hypothetical protein